MTSYDIGGIVKEREEEMLLTITEVAKELKVSRRTIKRWVQAGSLNAIRLSPHIVRIEEQEIERFKRGGNRT